MEKSSTLTTIMLRLPASKVLSLTTTRLVSHGEIRLISSLSKHRFGGRCHRSRSRGSLTFKSGVSTADSPLPGDLARPSGSHQDLHDDLTTNNNNDNISSVPTSTDLLELYRGLVAQGKLKWDDEQVRCVMKVCPFLVYRIPFDQVPAG